MRKMTRTNRSVRLPEFDAPPDGRLTREMLEAFKTQGVLILRDFVTRVACDELRQHVLELVAGFDATEVRSVFSTTRQAQLDDDYFIDSGDKIRFFLEDGAFTDSGELRQRKEDSLNKIGHAMHDLDPVFDRFSRTPRLAETVHSIGYEQPGIIQSMYIFKPPRIGGEVVWHQDSTYIYTEPESCTGFWFALEDAAVENGCMHFLPGAHRGPLRQRNRRDGRGKLDDAPWPDELAAPAEAEAGSLVIFDGRAPHYSGPNRSAKSRHAYTLHVIDQRCRYPADNWLQRGPHMPLRGFGAA
jgi:phytanoyl-CoA hydroxylase